MYYFNQLKELWGEVRVGDNVVLNLDENVGVFPLMPKKEVVILEGIGGEIWRNIEKNSSIENTIEYFMKMYKVDKDELIDDMYNFIIALLNEGLITIQSSKLKKDELSAEIEDFIDKESIAYNYSLIYSYYERKLKPYKVFLELLYTCNLRCKHCYLGTEKDTDYELVNFERLKSLIFEMKENGVVELFITGGEAGIYPQLIELLEFACSQKLIVTLLTNGTCFTDDDLDKLSSIGLHDVRISFYGLEEYHDNFVDMKGAFAKSLNTLKILNSKCGIGTASAIITKENIDQLIKLRQYLEKSNIDMDISPLIFPTLYGDLEPTEQRIEIESLKDVIKTLDIRVGGSICTAGISRFRITPYGEVNPCEMLRNINLGNIKNSSFKEILESTAREDWIEKLNKFKDESCSGCLKKKYCINCIGLGSLESDKENISKYACELAQTQYSIYEEI